MSVFMFVSHVFTGPSTLSTHARVKSTHCSEIKRGIVAQHVFGSSLRQQALIHGFSRWISWWNTWTWHEMTIMLYIYIYLFIYLCDIYIYMIYIYDIYIYIWYIYIYIWYVYILYIYIWYIYMYWSMIFGYVWAFMVQFIASIYCTSSNVHQGDKSTEAGTVKLAWNLGYRSCWMGYSRGFPNFVQFPWKTW